MTMILLERIMFLLVDLFTLVLAYMALIGWGAVFSGTAAANSDGGIAIVFTFLAVFMGTMSWIARGR